MENKMKHFIGMLVAALISSPALALTANEIMVKVDAVAEPESMSSNMTMVLVDNKGKQRVRVMTSVSANIDGIDKSMMFLLKPTEVKGTGFLMFDYESAQQDDDQWMFLPNLNKAKRIASGDKTGSFMGSDFSYADMTKRNLEEWTYTILKEDDVKGVKVWIVESIPIDDSVIDKTGYVRSIAYVRQDNFQIIRGISYLKKKGEVKLMNVSKFIEVEGYWLAIETQMVSQKNGKTIHRTLMKTSDVKINFDFDESDFTLNRLEQGL